jgi:hypothetical protein
MKKSLVIGLIVLFVCIAFAPCINANVNFNRNILNNGNENFNCFIVGRATYTGFIIPGGVIFRNVHVLKFPKPLIRFENRSISFGYKFICDYQDIFGPYPSSGWIWTKGSNGVKTWRGDSLWGNLGKKDVTYTHPFGPIVFDDFSFYIGIKGFTGFRIGMLSSCLFIGTASHINIVTDFPG